MIKRNGVEVMNERTTNVSIAKETINILKNKHYTAPSGDVVDISESLDAALAGTILYKNDWDPTDYTVGANKNTTTLPSFEIINESTTQAAVRLSNEGKKNIVALNFASAKNPGGGFLGGALAQEEDLCRCSGLYACVKSKPMFYNENILSESRFYTDAIIYSPNVPFFRSDNLVFLDKPFELSIISAPAPNVRGIEIPEGQEDDYENVLFKTLCNRAVKILKVAEAHGHKNIILGAWGCGAFGNDPHEVAYAFELALLIVPSFEHVCFAVYDRRDPPVVYNGFKKFFVEE